MKASRWKKITAATGGSEIAEAALVLPLAFLLLLAIYWFGRAFNVYATINHAAREGARVGVASSCGNCGNAASSPAAVAVAVTTTLQASAIDPTKISLYAPPSPIFCSGTASSNCDNSHSNITVCSQVQLTPATSPGPPVCGVSVSFQYPYSFSLPYPTNGVNLALKADVQMGAEN